MKHTMALSTFRKAGAVLAVTAALFGSAAFPLVIRRLQQDEDA